MGERTRRAIGGALVAVAFLYGLISLGPSLRDLWDDPPSTGAGAVTDPSGDPAPGGPAADDGQPPGIDLVSAGLIRDDGALTFTATTTEEAGEHTRTWVLRIRKPKGPLLYMLYAGDMPVGGSNVFLCRHDDRCEERVKGAFTESAPPRSIRVRIPLDRLSKLPETFEWEASVSSSPTANIDDTWNDFAPTALLRPLPRG